MSIHVQRTATILKPDQSRVLLRPFMPGDRQRADRIIARVMSIPEEQVGPLLDEVSAEFSQRHQQIHRLFRERFEQVRSLVSTGNALCEPRRLLIGSYFLAEYSLESSALFNPSLLPHPNQTNLPPRGPPFLPRLRPPGESHLASTLFHTGILTPR